MELQIKDGSGKSYVAKVDSNLRLHVDSVSRTQSQQAALAGNAYNISTGLITLTSANESAVFYLGYTGEDGPLIVKEIGVSLSAPTGGSGATIVSIAAGSSNSASGSTIVTNADAVTTNFNRDVGSSKILPANVYKGAEGYTLTGLTSAGTTSRTSYTEPIIFDAEIFVLRKGSAIGVLVDPPASTTSQTVVVFATVFIETADIDGA